MNTLLKCFSECQEKNFIVVGKTSTPLEKLHRRWKNFINVGKTSSTFEVIFDEVFPTPLYLWSFHALRHFCSFRCFHFDITIHFDLFTSIYKTYLQHRIVRFMHFDSSLHIDIFTSIQVFTSIFSLRLFCHFGPFTSTQDFTSFYSLRSFPKFLSHFHIDSFTSI